MKLRILIATHRMGWRSGSEVHSRDLALGLRKRGHDCAIYTPKLAEDGDVRSLRRAGVSVTDRIARLPWKPDVIHGHHRWETIRACIAFPAAPALQVCHDATNRRDRAAGDDMVQLHCAVDDYCKERVARETGRPADSIPLLLNAVDLSVFPCREAPPATPPRQAVVFHSQADGSADFGPAEAACRRLGIALTRVGRGAGRFSETPADTLAQADLVFAKARCALEAMAAGCHVILLGEQGMGPAIRPDNFDTLRRRNFGRSLLAGPVTDKAVIDRILALDRAAAAEVTQLARAHCDIDSLAATAESLHLKIATTNPNRTGILHRGLGLMAWLRTEYCRIRTR